MYSYRSYQFKLMMFKLINSNKCHIQMTSSYVIYLLIKPSAHLAGTSINI